VHTPGWSAGCGVSLKVKPGENAMHGGAVSSSSQPKVCYQMTELDAKCRLIALSRCVASDGDILMVWYFVFFLQARWEGEQNWQNL